MKKWLFLLLSLSSNLWAAPLFQQFAAPAATTQAAPQALLDAIAQTQTLKGTFYQTQYGRKVKKSQGQFFLKRPGKFRWDFKAPFAQQIVCDGQKVYYYDIDLAQVSVRPRSALSGAEAMDVLVGQKKLDHLFEVRAVTFAQVPQVLRALGKGAEYFYLKNKKASGENAWLVTTAAYDLRALLLVREGSGSTLIRFEHVLRNAAIPDARFHFVAPKGVDVVGEE